MIKSDSFNKLLENKYGIKYCRHCDCVDTTVPNTAEDYYKTGGHDVSEEELVGIMMTSIFDRFNGSVSKYPDRAEIDFWYGFKHCVFSAENVYEALKKAVGSIEWNEKEN